MMKSLFRVNDLNEFIIAPYRLLQILHFALQITEARRKTELFQDFFSLDYPIQKATSIVVLFCDIRSKPQHEFPVKDAAAPALTLTLHSLQYDSRAGLCME